MTAAHITSCVYCRQPMLSRGSLSCTTCRRSFPLTPYELRRAIALALLSLDVGNRRTAALLGMSLSTIHAICTSHSIKRGRGRRSKNNARMRAIARAYAGGLSFDEIRADFHCSSATITKAREFFAIPPRYAPRS